MKKVLVLSLILLISMGLLNVNAKNFNITYKEGNYPLITDDNEHLAYQINPQSNKLFAYNWKMTDPYISTYYVFGGIDKVVNNKQVKQWISTSYASNLTMKDESIISAMGWNTGVIYNGTDYVIPSDVNAYKNAVNIETKAEENIGLAIKTEFKFRNEGKLLEVLYHVKNNSNSKKDFLLWSGGDTELAVNDHCTIGIIDETDARGVYLYSLSADYEAYPDSVDVQMPIFATKDDNVVQFWNTDRWSDIRDMYDITVDEKWASSITQLFSKGPSYIANISENQKPEDTASIWYWPGQSLKANEEKVYSILIGITNFTENVENSIIQVIKAANTEIENETHTVTFSLDHIKDGKTIPPQEVDSRGKVTRPEDPIHDGNMIFDDWYTDETFTTKFDFENTIITDATEIHGRWKLPPGTIKVIDPITKPDVVAKILTPSKDITDAITLTDEELTLKETGKNISVYVEVNDASDDVSDRDKTALEDKLDKKTEIGTYLDIGLFKKVDDETPTKIAKSKEPIELSIEIPKNLKNTDPNVERTYKLVKIENGELVEIELREDDGNLIFETDDFSIYALAYSDKRLNNPNTFDGITMYIIIFAISIILLRTIYITIRKTRGAN